MVSWRAAFFLLFSCSICFCFSCIFSNADNSIACILQNIHTRSNDRVFMHLNTLGEYMFSVDMFPLFNNYWPGKEFIPGNAYSIYIGWNIISFEVQETISKQLSKIHFIIPFVSLLEYRKSLFWCIINQSPCSSVFYLFYLSAFYLKVLLYNWWATNNLKVSLESMSPGYQIMAVWNAKFNSMHKKKK